MPRPAKKRYICCLPVTSAFVPEGKDIDNETVVMTVDEYETIRLIDYEGCMQEECAQQMRVSRTTVQGIYNEARKKIADALVNGKRLHINGGDYIQCRNYEKSCGKGCKEFCNRACCLRNKENDVE